MSTSDSPIQKLAKGFNQHLSMNMLRTMDYQTIIEHFKRECVKQSANAYIPTLFKLCHERHGGDFNGRLDEVGSDWFVPSVLILNQPMGIFGPTYVNGDPIPDVLSTIIVSTAEAFSKFSVITSYFLVPKTKYFMDIPVDVTAGFLEMVDDFRTKFRNWEVPDKEKLVNKIKSAIIRIHDAMISIENNVLLAEANNQTERLRSKLFEIAGQFEIDALDSALIENIKNSIVSLYVTLDELIEVETMESNQEFDATLRMIHRLRQKLLQMTDWNVLAELDVRIYTARCAGTA